jgi:hypothetical protein
VRWPPCRPARRDSPSLEQDPADPTRLSLGTWVRPDASVRGTLVHGLTERDIDRLTAFEGPEYALQPLVVNAFGPATPLKRGLAVDILGELPEHLGPQEVKARAYVWIAGEHLLETEPWEYVPLASLASPPDHHRLSHGRAARDPAPRRPALVR